jgi:hypothetical protein
MARRLKSNQAEAAGRRAWAAMTCGRGFEVQRVCSGVGISDRSFTRKPSICVPPSRIEWSLAELSDLNGLGLTGKVAWCQ